MQENPFSKQLRLLSISMRLGLSLALGMLAVLLLVGLVSVASPSFAPSDPGDLDTTFGSGGIVTTAIGPSYDYAYGVAIQPDGKIVAVGYAHSGSDNDFAVMRYTVSGDLDVTFGSGGVVTTHIGPSSDYAYGVAIQPDGRIVVVGYFYNGSDEDFAVARYTISGALDSTFGSGGIVTTSIGAYYDEARDVVIQPDGKIVAAGDTGDGGDHDLALVRYTVSGTLDSTFGSGGIVTTSIGPGYDGVESIAIQPDGKIVAAGHAYNGSKDEFLLARYTVSGTLDAAFGSGGVVTTSIGPGYDEAYGVAIQPDGKIVATGGASNGSNPDFALVRYTVSGMLDATFGSGGVVTTPIGPGYDQAYGVVIQPDGKIVAAGYAYSGSNNDFAVARYTVSGTPDPTFGNGGVVTTPIGLGLDQARDVAIQLDGKIVAVGYTNNGSDEDVALVRYHGRYAIYLPLVLKS